MLQKMWRYPEVLPARAIHGAAPFRHLADDGGASTAAGAAAGGEEGKASRKIPVLNLDLNDSDDFLLLYFFFNLCACAVLMMMFRYISSFRGDAPERYHVQEQWVESQDSQKRKYQNRQIDGQADTMPDALQEELEFVGLGVKPGGSVEGFYYGQKLGPQMREMLAFCMQRALGGALAWVPGASEAFTWHSWPQMWAKTNPNRNQGC